MSTGSVEIDTRIESVNASHKTLVAVQMCFLLSPTVYQGVPYLTKHMTTEICVGSEKEVRKRKNKYVEEWVSI